ncbi:hypothetical protein AABB24_008902 [Solanum stoloniferum]|uniref:Inosine/uridine-preferring nucleoside hydrolase domain-containing protein n=1 Tax=Solanum stoloniferum TaxID=62892 RepID=A0ABD2UJM6_9SOLN
MSILALRPLTNLALAVKRDSTFASKVKRVVVLGDSFFALGNINPAAEANVGDFFPNGVYKYYNIYNVLQFLFKPALICFFEPLAYRTQPFYFKKVKVRSACTPPFPGPICEITFGMLLLL